MACGLGLDAVDCAADHWSPILGGRREPSGQWRADCPVTGCGADRALQYDVPGKSKHVRWKSFCGHHDQDAVRPFLIAALGPCMHGGRRSESISPADLQALAMADLPPKAMKAQLLVWSGLTTTQALDKLGVDRTSRYRIRDQLSQFGDKHAGR